VCVCACVRVCMYVACMYVCKVGARIHSCLTATYDVYCSYVNMKERIFQHYCFNDGLENKIRGLYVYSFYFENIRYEVERAKYIFMY
jgi:hypothetical protein